MRLILCLALSGLATVTPAATKSGGPTSQFIDKSIVTYPTALGHYSLVKESYDPANVPNGVSLHYNLADAPPELTFDIYVYPLGRVDTTKAVTDATVEMEGEIRTLEQQKIYADLKFDDAVEFDVVEPPSSILKSDDKKDAASGDAPEAAASAAEPDSDTRAIVDAARSSAPSTSTTGRKHALALTVRGMPSESLAYVFYRNLFLISVRATAPTSALPADKFNALVDHAVQDLVPTMDIQNFGDCGTMYISVDEKSTDKDKDALAGAIQLVREMGRIQRENCANKPGPDTAPPAGHAQETIVYPAGFWK
jgi:hypothetical protein